MCGICGLWNRHGVSEQTVRAMAQEIRHRGPDEEGFYFRQTIGLANRRLSIIDLNAGKQPICNENGQVWVVFNGEIYNYPSLKQRLLQQGHLFKTNSDTEVIVHLYEEYGVDCVKELRGMFAFALWDEARQRLLLARDPLGQKPLYYTFQEDRFAFASEIKALLCDRTEKSQLNARAIHNYISLRYIPETDTLFQGIHKLLAGHILLLENGEVRHSPYWALHYTPKASGSEEELTAQLRQLLLETIDCHMLSDVPVGAFLSGGLDSSLIVAMMSAVSPKPIKTFSIGVREQSFDELPYARMVAARYGTDHHEMIVEADLVTNLPKMIWHMEEPVDPFAFGVFSAAQLASQHVKVVLGGDGGDELFAGYDRYVGNQLVELYCMLPSFLRRKILHPIIERLPDNYSYNNVVQKLRWLMAMSETDTGHRYAHSASYLRFSHVHKQVLYTDLLWQELQEIHSTDYLVQLFNTDNAEHLVDKMLYTDSKTRLADHLLMVGDRMTMAHSLEGRSPFVDQQVVEFVAHMPATLKIKGRQLKYVQRQIAREFLPKELIERPKKGFGFPLAYWFRGELGEVTARVFESSMLVEAGYLRLDSMMALLQSHRNGVTDHNYRLWVLLNLELWYRIFMGNSSVETLKAYLQESMKPVKLYPAAPLPNVPVPQPVQ
ncbi:MAG: asparagine synthase (glutamine-hydrolyzing) [Caldilineaceae bacterium]|nr:asparagine synthase (glutamine-hydrolyzing) [Caldilineaceae bacterium]